MQNKKESKVCTVKRYQGKKRPICLKGEGCARCWKIYAMELEKKLDAEHIGLDCPDRKKKLMPANKKMSAKEAEAQGYTIDRSAAGCWYAYKGPRFRPIEGFEVETENETYWREQYEKYILKKGSI